MFPVTEWPVTECLLYIKCHFNTWLNLVWHSHHQFNNIHLNTVQVKFVIQMFPLFKCWLFRSPLYYHVSGMRYWFCWCQEEPGAGVESQGPEESVHSQLVSFVGHLSDLRLALTRSCCGWSELKEPEWAQCLN